MDTYWDNLTLSDAEKATISRALETSQSRYAAASAIPNQRALALTNYIFGTKHKLDFRYRCTIMWWNIKQVLEYIINRPLCVLGIHRKHDGMFHTRIDRFGERDGFKCYHCRYCDKPSNKELHKQQV